jgi:hypothetical protein
MTCGDLYIATQSHYGKGGFFLGKGVSLRQTV